MNSPFKDMDASPTKAWLITHKDEHDVEPLYQLAFGKRPKEELYDLKNDPDYMFNIANDPKYSDIKRRLEEKLFNVLIKHDDPRILEEPCKFEFEPYAGPLSIEQLDQIFTTNNIQKNN